jgi:benzoyl-CoA reductase/2-hydroxyglutaryl-CoA dehydratase subunit BcrC/BadD/HgdB
VFPEVVLFDVLNTPYQSTADYVYERVVALKSHLEKSFNCSIGAAQCHAAISVLNQNRLALQDLNALRRLSAPVLCGADFLTIVGAAHYMERAEHTELAQAVVTQAAHMPSFSGVRLMVKGAPHDTAAFYALVESLGAIIVADDHSTGERSIEHLIDESIAPLTAIAQHYHLHAPSIRAFPQSVQDQHFIEIVLAAKVEGVIFFHDEFDDTLGWDYPQQKKMLDQRGIASVFLQQQSYRTPDRAAQSAAVRDLMSRSRT